MLIARVLRKTLFEQNHAETYCILLCHIEAGSNVNRPNNTTRFDSDGGYLWMTNARKYVQRCSSMVEHFIFLWKGC